MPPAIHYVDRATRQVRVEKVYGSRGEILQTGRFSLNVPCFPGALSKLYGAYNDTKFSAARVPQFIRDFSINMAEYEEPAGFKSFNDFFTRRFKPGARPFPADVATLGSPPKAEWLTRNSMPIRHCR